MNEWTIAAVVLLAILLPCLVLPAVLRPFDGLIALEVSSLATTAILLLLAEGTNRQSFVDLGLVFAGLSFVGALALARIMERRL
jgi:multisubunit Na+/H+ antiporter MnhF subunit